MGTKYRVLGKKTGDNFWSFSEGTDFFIIFIFHLIYARCVYNIVDGFIRNF